MHIRNILSAAVLLAAAIGSAAGASAGAWSSPPASVAPLYRTVAATELTVSKAYVNLRDHPARSGKLVKKLTQGTKVTVIETTPDGKWAHVRVNNLEGYVAANSLK
jgi:uncharacterized protein YgiM (DUF1202 family)